MLSYEEWGPVVNHGDIMRERADMVNHPPHYVHPSGVECIDIVRHIKDMRLSSSMQYIWRVAFGGKFNNREDIKKAIFYLNDWLDHPIEGQEKNA